MDVIVPRAEYDELALFVKRESRFYRAARDIFPQFRPVFCTERAAANTQSGGSDNASCAGAGKHFVRPRSPTISLTKCPPLAVIGTNVHTLVIADQRAFRIHMEIFGVFTLAFPLNFKGT